MKRMAPMKFARPRDSSATGSGASTFDTSIDADYVIFRLEEGGATLLALPGSGWTTRLRSSSIDIVRTSLEAYGWEATRIRPAVPSPDKIDRMDEAMTWIPLIPNARFVLRRVVGRARRTDVRRRRGGRDGEQPHARGRQRQCRLG